MVMNNPVLITINYHQYSSPVFITSFQRQLESGPFRNLNAQIKRSGGRRGR
jgi:hypothetical protein